MSGDIIAQFADLFDGRKDAYGTDGGGCHRPNGSWSWAGVVERHLRGEFPIGVYPMVYMDTFSPHWYVKWGCVDQDTASPTHKSFDHADEGDCHTAMLNVQKVLRTFGAVSWMERTRSGGRHLWVFSETWVPASVMRRALLVACVVAGASSREVNPKSESLGAGQVGNYVRIMYPGALAAADMAGGPTGRGGLLRSGHQSEWQPASDHSFVDDGSRRSRASYVCGGCGDWCLRLSAEAEANQDGVLVGSKRAGRRGGVDDDALPTDGRATAGDYSEMPKRVALLQDGRPLCISCFTTMAADARASAGQLEHIARLYKEPERVPIATLPDYVNGLPQHTFLFLRLNALAKHLYNKPVDQISDRSMHIEAFVRASKDSGLTASETLTLADELAARCGKFDGRADRERQLRIIVERAWT